MTVTTPPVAPEVTPILDRLETELEKNRVPAEIWNNEAIFRAELDQIFGACWVSRSTHSWRHDTTGS